MELSGCEAPRLRGTMCHWNLWAHNWTEVHVSYGDGEGKTDIRKKNLAGKDTKVGIKYSGEKLDWKAVAPTAQLSEQEF